MEGVDGYFVSNDILRFLDEQETIIIPAEDVPTAFSTSALDDVSTNDVLEEVVSKKSFLSVRKVETVKGTSIFVGNLAMDSKPEELYEAFKSFGPIKRKRVQIRTDKLNRCFAFIQFESSGSTQSAIQTSFIIIGNQKLNIQEKKRKDFENRKFSQESINGNGPDNFKGGKNFTRRNGPAN
ncbi:hypothetical protein CRYUN_Cryun24cG0092100 [Craigia yunnanensis]